MSGWLWSVVLAGGAGRRLSAVTHGTPKQFWRLDGQCSLLEETLARVAPLAPAARTTLVVDRTHEGYVRETSLRPVGDVLYQPQDRGTAAGVLLGLTPVLEASPGSVVVLAPSDHGVLQPARFRRGIAAAAAAIESGALDVIVFGVMPSEPCTDYGWITPGPRHAVKGTRLQQVVGFAEKPSREEAERLFHAGAVWNTMVVVAKADALWRLYETHLPHLARLFAEYLRTPLTGRRDLLIDRYAGLASSDFSRDLLTPARGLAVYTWPASLGWADLGTPDRFLGWLDRAPARKLG
jgi:mannose-1-phosphate guanylyltransferase